MKKLITAMTLVLGLGFATAQQAAPATASKAHQQVTKPAKMVDAKAVKATDTKVAKPAAPSTTAVKMKKDGTPDKRYKDAQHLKKDGTPDKRYKENK
ncbi:hypothetical protein [Chryseobacterium sp. ERMR1:04]|uniref:hypothetical protein n=1 Tax=Chryseobacterium sp. ERMR1:04 TaxID=1705393 RepID=UPI0006C87A99|nr:hypothetical protein [Chryseobacterium sp. ERMR1:04]KPH11502.1 hypothetical protein AMQ68_19055 [Chryseobacterium sp. ERMR1:04]